jgi:hypothetical protein
MLALMVLAFAPVAAGAKEGKESHAHAKGTQVSVTGVLTCTFCKLSHPEKACETGCCEKCIKAGDPALLTANDGEQFILITSEKEVALMTPERYALVGGPVTVKGMKVKGKGVQVIYVESMEKAPALSKK